jgi:hypothetical protein
MDHSFFFDSILWRSFWQLWLPVRFSGVWAGGNLRICYHLLRFGLTVIKIPFSRFSSSLVCATKSTTANTKLWCGVQCATQQYKTGRCKTPEITAGNINEGIAITRLRRNVCVTYYSRSDISTNEETVLSRITIKRWHLTTVTRGVFVDSRKPALRGTAAIFN